MKPASLAKQVFGHLTALRYRYRAKWVCRCSCGNETVVSTSQLQNGNITSCGCQPTTRVMETVPHNSLPLALAIAEALLQTPNLTSKQLAEHLKVPHFSMVGVMKGLQRKGIVETLRSPGRGVANHWFLLVPTSQISSLFAPEVAQRLPKPVPALKGQIGITPEDEQWMQHYRARWIHRYLRRGETPPLRTFV